MLLDLRYLDVADADSLYLLDSDPEVMRWINGGHAIDRNTFDEQVLPVYLRRDDSLFGFHAIEYEGGFAGWVSLRRSEAQVATLGYRIARDYWRLGLASSAAGMLIDRAWRESSIRRITATAYEENQGSRRVLEKLGFRLEKRFRMSVDTLDANDTSISDGILWDGDDLEFVIERG